MTFFIIKAAMKDTSLEELNKLLNDYFQMCEHAFWNYTVEDHLPSYFSPFCRVQLYIVKPLNLTFAKS